MATIGTIAVARARRVLRFISVAVLTATLAWNVASAEDVAKPSAPSDSSVNDASAPASLDDALEAVRKKQGVPALAGAVVRDGRIIAIGATGRRAANAEPQVTVDDRFHIGSCTKSMTATLCAMLVEQGAMRWDSTVGEIFAELQNKVDPAFQKVTLQQLVCHRSGVAESKLANFDVFVRLRALSGDLGLQRRNMVWIAMGRPPTYQPGETFEYSNVGFAIAGAMCEAVTKESYESLLKQRLFEPLGMTTAGFGAPGSDRKIDQPRGHVLQKGEYVWLTPSIISDNPEVIAPAGTVHCSIGDWAKYAALHLEAGRGKPRLLKAESFAKLHSDPFKQEYGFGWGFAKTESGKGRRLTHAGSNTLWFAVINISPKENLAVLTATNAGSKSANEACLEADKAVRDLCLKSP
jgi:CubicO group peptidase (beta-lactamase class C family)